MMYNIIIINEKDFKEDLDILTKKVVQGKGVIHKKQLYVSNELYDYDIYSEEYAKKTFEWAKYEIKKDEVLILIQWVECKEGLFSPKIISVERW